MLCLVHAHYFMTNFAEVIINYYDGLVGNGRSLASGWHAWFTIIRGGRVVKERSFPPLRLHWQGEGIHLHG